MAKRRRKIAIVVCCKVEIIHRTRDGQIRIRVKSFHKSAALMPEIAFHLENIAKERKARTGGGFARALAAAEFTRQRLFAEIGDMRGPAGNRKPARRHAPALPIPPPL